MKLTIYHQANLDHKWNMHDLFRQLILHLIDNYDVDLVYEEGFTSIDHGDWVETITNLRIDKWDINLRDCELLIYDEQNDILRGLSFAESDRRMVALFTERNNPNDILYIANQSSIFFDNNNDTGVLLPDVRFKIKNTCYYAWDPMYNLEYFYHERRFKKREDIIDKMVGGYGPGSDRRDIVKLSEMGILHYFSGKSYKDYLLTLIDYKIGLSISSSAEVSHRDFECMAMGIPMMRLKYMTQLYPPLIPDYHYISVDNSNFPKDMWLHRIGGDEYIEAYKNRFMEVKDDFEFLQFIAENGRQYYLENSAPHTRLATVLKQLEL